MLSKLMGFLTAVLLSVLITTTQAYAQTPTANNNTNTTTTGGLTSEAQSAIEEYFNKPQQERATNATATTPTTPPPAPPTITTTTTTDPELQKFDQIASGCQATIQRMYPGAQRAEDVFLVAPSPGTGTSTNYDQMTQCNQLLRQAIAQYCNMLQTYDATKCAYVNTPQTLSLIDTTAIIAESEFLHNLGESVVP